MAETNLAALGGVGTSFHTLKLSFVNNQITVFYDGTQVINTVDVEAQPLVSGAVSLELWNDAAPFISANHGRSALEVQGRCLSA